MVARRGLTVWSTAVRSPDRVGPQIENGPEVATPRGRVPDREGAAGLPDTSFVGTGTRQWLRF